MSSAKEHGFRQWPPNELERCRQAAAREAAGDTDRGQHKIVDDLRLDDARYGFHIDDVVAEALAPGENSLRGQTSINQRAAATAQWVETNRGLLVQSNLSVGEPRAPDVLIKLYGVRAQMLAPVERQGRLGARGAWAAKLDRAGSGCAAQGRRPGAARTRVNRIQGEDQCA